MSTTADNSGEVASRRLYAVAEAMRLGAYTIERFFNLRHRTVTARDARDRYAYELHFVDGLAWDIVAKLFGIPEDRAREFAHRHAIRRSQSHARMLAAMREAEAEAVAEGVRP